jgi:hypothetical protein
MESSVLMKEVGQFKESMNDSYIFGQCTWC